MSEDTEPEIDEVICGLTQPVFIGFERLTMIFLITLIPRVSGGKINKVGFLQPLFFLLIFPTKTTAVKVDIEHKHPKSNCSKCQNSF